MAYISKKAVHKKSCVPSIDHHHRSSPPTQKYTPPHPPKKKLPLTYYAPTPVRTTTKDRSKYVKPRQKSIPTQSTPPLGIHLAKQYWKRVAPRTNGVKRVKVTSSPLKRPAATNTTYSMKPAKRSPTCRSDGKALKYALRGRSLEGDTRNRHGMPSPPPYWRRHRPPYPRTPSHFTLRTVTNHRSFSKHRWAELKSPPYRTTGKWPTRTRTLTGGSRSRSANKHRQT